MWWVDLNWRHQQHVQLNMYKEGSIKTHLCLCILFIQFSIHRSSLVAQMLKNLTAIYRGPWFDSWVGKICWRGIGYSHQYCWAFWVAQLVKNSPTMQETCVQSLDWENPLENGTGSHSSTLAWRIPWTVQPMGSQESDMAKQLSLSLYFNTHTCFQDLPSKRFRK